MTSVELNDEVSVVDALVLAGAFGLTEDEVREKMRGGLITSRSEKGEGEDEGRWRLTFHHDGRALLVIVDDRGTVLKRTTFPIRIRQVAARLGA